MKALPIAAVIAGVISIVAGAPAERGPTPDPAAAEAHYRVAQRLAAEGDPGAAAAFETAVADAPNGPLAGPALLGLARLQRIPEWPEEVALVDAKHAAAASAAVARVLALPPQDDLAQEARYLASLLRLAPLEGRDAAKARAELITIATSRKPSVWAGRARYALGCLDESQGAYDRAAGAYARLIVEEPGGAVPPRARVGLARMLARSGKFGDALALLDAESLEPASQGAALRLLARRALERETIPARRWSATADKPASIPVGRGAVLFAALPGGGVFVWDRKTSSAQFLAAEGAVTAAVPLEGVTAVATDPSGRVHAALRDRVVRIEPRGVVATFPFESFGAIGALAVDAGGTVWVADRRGDRIALSACGGPVRVVREARGAGVSALVAAGAGVVAAEEKTGRLVAIAPDGAEAALGPAVFRRPVALAADAAGQIAVGDEKDGTITLVGPDGALRDTLSLEAAGIGRAGGLAFAADGSLRILDAAEGRVVSVP